MPKEINEFRGEYRFLSNFWGCPVNYDGVAYQNAEAAFQAQKCIDPTDRTQLAGLNPSEAKRLGRRVKLRSDWEAIKDQIMCQVVQAKFTQNPDLMEKLKATGDAVLIEGNTWGDRYWGVCRGTGQNKLGRILMALRDANE